MQGFFGTNMAATTILPTSSNKKVLKAVPVQGQLVKKGLVVQMLL
jgi:hypothetical protein